jgi:hypothetical protein
MRSSPLVIALLIVGATSVAHAQAPIQLSLVTPIQIVPADKAVKGLRFNLIYGTNTAVVGLDLGLVNNTTGGPSEGVQWGGINLVTGTFTGWQSGFVNVQKGSFKGLQTGWINLSGPVEGLQWGLYNSGTEVNGLQLSVVNYAKRIHGVQVGLVNIIKEGGQFPIFPIVNWGKN